MAALYDHLVRSKVIDLADGLPPVLPIMIYNGDARWSQSPEVFDLIQSHPAVLTEFQPRLKFWLLDEGWFNAEYLEGLQRVMAAIFRMEHAHDTEEVKLAIRYLGRAVDKSPFKQTIDKAVMKWTHYRLSRKLHGLPMPDVDDILKGNAMLETNLDRIKASAVAEGILLGKLEGRLEGRLEGKLEGEAMLLERQIVKRFGSMPIETRTRL